MLEQSKLNGPVYKSAISGKTIATKVVNISDVKFGQPRDIIIHRNPNTTLTLVEDVETSTGYIYDEFGSFVKTVPASTQDNDVCQPYKLGIAEVDGVKHQYLLQNQPPVTLPDQPDLTKFEMPASMIGYPYQETFTYSQELLDLLGHIRATYVDRFKRPLNPYIIKSRVYLPIGIDKVQTRFKSLANKNQHFPIVLDLADTEFGLLDLEPGYSQEDLDLVESYDYIYKESTPRGGIHYLIRTNSKAFKFRHTPHLEVIVNAMVTFYGGGEMVNINAEPVNDFKDADELGHKHIEVSEATQDVKEIVDRIQQYADENALLGEAFVRNRYLHDTDLSHADFVASLHLYNKNVKPYISNHKSTNIDKKDVPWILAEYMSRIIEFRLKHHRTIQGVPYLVYVATKVVNDN